jgi:hypothetical protein
LIVIGPFLPWPSPWPFASDSILLKNGRTRSQPHSGLPRFTQAAKSSGLPHCAAAALIAEVPPVTLPRR